MPPDDQVAYRAHVDSAHRSLAELALDAITTELLGRPLADEWRHCRKALVNQPTCAMLMRLANTRQILVGSPAVVSWTSPDRFACHSNRPARGQRDAVMSPPYYRTMLFRIRSIGQRSTRLAGLSERQTLRRSPDSRPIPRGSLSITLDPCPRCRHVSSRSRANLRYVVWSG